MRSLIEHIRLVVKPKEYYDNRFPKLRWPTSGSEARTASSLREGDTKPSLSLNGETGAWYDHGLGQGGNSIISFHAADHGTTSIEAARDIFSAFIHPTVKDSRIRRYARGLTQTPSFQRYLLQHRFLSREVIKQFNLGSVGDRIAIPIRNEFGLCVNIRLYDPGRHANAKMLNYTTPNETRSFGSPPMLYPLNILKSANENEPIIVCEGEWDTLALISLGLLAVTSTSGCKSWPSQYNEFFRNRQVIIAYDNDKDGELYDRVVLRNLLNIARTIHRLKIPKNVGKDVTDWIRTRPAMRKVRLWKHRIKMAPLLVDNPPEFLQVEIADVNFSTAACSTYLGKRIRTTALVAGKGLSLFVPPKRARLLFYCDRTCEHCPISKTDKEVIEVEVDPAKADILETIGATKLQIKKMLFRLAGVDLKKGCQVAYEVIEPLDIQQLLLIPTLDDEGPYVMTTGYYIGREIQTNRAYEFEGTVVADPRTQEATYLLDRGVPIQGEIDSFELTPDLKKQLRKFQPRRQRHRRDLISHLGQIADWQSRNVTEIRGRPELHIIVDLAFHSVAEFDFHGEQVPRGMLDILILGDTRSGKGYVTERLVNYYRMGQVASGENCSFAGLVGGCESINRRFIVKWGLIPLNHRRLVVIDEASSLMETEIGRMSRIRSEGVAEITKIVREQTKASTRLIWLANPRSGRGIMSYNYGIQAVKELIGTNEDLSRFDLAMTLASNEVPQEVINDTEPLDTTDKNQYPAELCRALILWAWSRSKNQIVFTNQATRDIIQMALQFGRKYTPAIPLVQGENMRIKLAKISAAVAARMFSTDDICENVLVNSAHVDYAQFLLQCLYDRPSMGYDLFSQTTTQQTEIQDKPALEKCFDQLGVYRKIVLTYLIGAGAISIQGLGDYLDDPLLSRSLISSLIKLGCLVQVQNMRRSCYEKTPSFNSWLRHSQRFDEKTKAAIEGRPKHKKRAQTNRRS